MESSNGAILREGESCWRVETAERIAFLIDAESYFSALCEAMELAERSILITGWDIHSRVVLRRGGDGSAETLSELLNRLARRRSKLHIHILGWDFALIYSLEREALPLLRFGLRSHRRVHFRLDGDHPVGASHHQKIVVVDDSVAFVGGIDLAPYRWDTPEHRPEDERRVTPSGDAYGPFHDVQMAVEGPAAAALGDLVRERWRRATGETLDAPSPGSRWPASVEPALRRHPVAIARTEPAWGGRDEVREVEQLYLDAIRATERVLYVENQYLTSARVAEALAERLRESQGPEIVLVGPQRCSGWLEEATMGVLRARLLRRLRDADVHGRLRVVYPAVGRSPQHFVNLHSKLLVADDRFLRIGSANLSNRSMGLDTECDLALEGTTDEARRAAAGLRDRLIAEHVGAAETRVAELLAREGSLLAALDRLREESSGDRALLPLEVEDPDPAVEALVPDASVIDPERPIAVQEWLEQFPPETEPDTTSRRGAWIRIAAVALPIVALALLWRFGLPEDGSEGIVAAVRARLEPFRSGPLEWPLVLTVFTLGSVMALPVTLMIVVAALLFGPGWGFAYSLSGVLSGAIVGYALGRLLWRDAVRSLAGPRLNKLSRDLGERGILAILFVRVVPVAPFAVVNLVAGSSHVGFRDYVLGTLIGMTPGIAAMTIFADRLSDAVRNPSAKSLAIAGAVGLAVLLGAVWVRRRLGTAPPLKRTEEARTS